MQPEVSVDIEGLHATGIRIRTPLVGVDHAISQELPRLTVAGGAASWDAAPVVQETAARWSDYLRDLTLRTRRLGDDLIATADEFKAADQASAHSFNIPIPAAEPPAASYNFPVR
ncbi:hypothetical protein [Actinoplanes flavus]|uniref:Excreted virulence factor EspC, type VII ESX diderm n=1 Tax=Actinoplanes flavus TaxID=2820290 RepID=A0ABS3USF0_9ACTN|nr:hypothetical protein [Actinoplanes flavus]MBO3741498.1 hypothetical protein [Actinoplanes flavus]